jgi:hypothetical protein
MTTTRFLKPEKAAKETAAEQRNEFVHMGLYDADASPESERRRESNPLSFNALPSIERLALDQGVPPTTKFEDLLGSSWPEDESVDDFLEARRRWRLEGRDSDA